MSETSPRVTQVGEEIAGLHRFFVSWFSGRCEDSDDLFRREFLERFDPAFLLVPPAGTMLPLSALAGSVRERHGVNPEFRISIRNVSIRRSFPGHVLATYEEWQRNASASIPPDNGRVATALFRVNRRFQWLHVHETWLPTDVMAAGPYDF